MQPRLVSSIMACLLLAACPGKEKEEEGTETTEETGPGETGEATTTTTTTTGTETGTTTGTETGTTAGETGTTAGETGTTAGETGTTAGETGTTGGGLEGCLDIAATYEELVAKIVCNSDEQCHVLDGHCEIGLGGCWHVVNQEVTQDDLDTLADTFEGLACMGGVCACAPPPAKAECKDGMCSAG